MRQFIRNLLNVIPESALLKLNLRFFDLAVRQQMIDGIRSINNGIARTYGMPEDKLPTMVMKGHSTPLINDAALAERLSGPLKGLLDEKNVVSEYLAVTGSEDFHLLRGENDQVPYLYMWVGVADPSLVAQAQQEGKLLPFSTHNPNYKLDLKAIPIDTKIATLSALELLAKGASN